MEETTFFSTYSVYFYIILGLAVLVGAVVGIYKAFKSNENDDPNSYGFLLKNQFVCDKLSMNEIKKWFLANQSRTEGNAVFFLAKPSAETSRLFALNRPPKNLDTDHCLLQAVVDDKTNLPAAMRLISFSSASNDITSYFENRNYVIVDLKKEVVMP